MADPISLKAITEAISSFWARSSALLLWCLTARASDADKCGNRKSEGGQSSEAIYDLAFFASLTARSTSR